jgi:hypothetical protein
MENGADYIRYDTWNNHRSSTFFITTPDGDIALELIKLSSQKLSPQQEQFSVFLKGPREIYLPQHIYTMHHKNMGVFDLFLVPVAQELDGIIYEAAFNKLIDHKE